MHRHWHHGGGQVLQVTSQCLAQGVHVQGLQVTQGPICQGTDFPWEVDTALCTQLAAGAANTHPRKHHTPASYHGTQHHEGAQAALGQPM